MNKDLLNNLLARFCTMHAADLRRATAIHLQTARIQRLNFIGNRDHAIYKGMHKAGHATCLDMSRLCRRAAELVAKHGQRSEINAYPVSL